LALPRRLPQEGDFRLNSFPRFPREQSAAPSELPFQGRAGAGSEAESEPDGLKSSRRNDNHRKNEDIQTSKT